MVDRNNLNRAKLVTRKKYERKVQLKLLFGNEVVMLSIRGALMS